MKTKIISFVILVFTFTALTSKDLRASERNDTIHNANDSVLNLTATEKPVNLTPNHWNVIKFNPTPMLLFNELRNITFSYERLINKNNSVALQLGYLIIPQVLNDTVLNIIRLDKYSKKGINIAFDYRHYPWSRNRRPTPDGLYVGGYLSFYGTSFTNKFTTINAQEAQPGSFTGRLSMTNLGFEIGYQFVFGKRFSIDLLMFGPSITCYTRKMDLTGIVNDDFYDQIDEELASKIMERFPALGFLYRGDTSTFSGSNIVLSSSFRYSLQFGYHF
jgi:hypothetical protein